MKCPIYKYKPENEREDLFQGSFSPRAPGPRPQCGLIRDSMRSY